MKSYIYILSLFMIVGCGTTTLEPMKNYTLISYEQHISYTRYGSIQIMIPTFLKNQNSKKIYYTYSPLEQDSYTSSQWSENLSKMIASNFVVYLDSTGIFKNVISFDTTLDSDYRLETIVYDISHHITKDTSIAKLDIKLFFIKNSTNKIIKSKRFTYTANTQTTDAKGFVEALNGLFVKLYSDMKILF